METGRALAGRQVTKEDGRIAAVDTGVDLMPPPLGQGEQGGGLSWTAALSTHASPASSSTSPTVPMSYPSRHFLMNNGTENPSPPKNKERGGEIPQLRVAVL